MHPLGKCDIFNDEIPMSTLYRKYRPQRFSDVVGQSHIKTTIQNELKGNSHAHSYLFCGPRGTGKTSMARLLAKAVNCEKRNDGEYEPCNECGICTEIMAGSCLDVIEIDAASNTGVDNVRDNIINTARFSPNNAKYKVFIIDEVHMLSTSAFNALLKVLEEPPSYVVFILATTEIHKILPTIISRCQRFDFRKIHSPELKQKLQDIVQNEGIEVEEAVLDIVTAQSQGCLRDAQSLLGQVLTIDNEKITLEQARLVIPYTDYSKIEVLVRSITEGTIEVGIQEINRLIEDGHSVTHFTKTCVEYLRKILLLKIGNSDSSDHIDLDEIATKNIEELAKVFDIGTLVKIIDIFIKAVDDVKSSAIVQLPLELALIEAFEIYKGKSEPATVATQVRQSTATPQVQAQSVEVKSNDVVDTVNVNQPEPKSVDERKANVSEFTDPVVEETQVQEEAVASHVDVSEPVVFDGNLQELWLKIIAEVKKDGYSLSFVLSSGGIISFEHNTITVAFKHAFNKDKVDEPKNRDVLMHAIKLVLGKPVNLQVIVDKSLAGIERKESISLSEARMYSVQKVDKMPAPKEDPATMQETSHAGTTKDDANDAPFNDVLDVFGGEVVG